MLWGVLAERHWRKASSLSLLIANGVGNPPVSLGILHNIRFNKTMGFPENPVFRSRQRDWRAFRFGRDK
jgi:hypothetical protein